jgi:heat shock protein HslJ
MLVRSSHRVRLYAVACALFLAVKQQSAQEPNEPLATSLREVQDIEHRLTSAIVDGVALELPASPPLSISFGEDGKVSGRSGVNRYFGQIELTGNGGFRWSGAGIGATRMAGDPKLMELEAQFLKGLRSTGTIRMDSDLITMSSDDGMTVLKLDKGTVDKAIAELQDLELVLVRFILNGNEVQLPKRAKVTLQLFERTRFTGRSSVNTYSGSFAVKPDGHLDLSLSGATQRAGSPEAMEFEGTYFSALPRIQRLKPLVGGLILESDDKTVLLEFRSP